MMKLHITFAAAFLFLAAAANAQIVVIANSSVSADSISKSDLVKVFTGASTRLASGARVTPALLKEGPLHAQFASTYLGKSPIALVVIWRGLVLSGQAAMPKTFGSEVEMTAYVARTPGAIGYVGEKTPHDGVKELHVTN
ncbi:MAG: hypothetical protein ABR905_06415 [Terracidiphilus sp.]|jgi:ABC-type phosphate transport system substrate-binding protein